MARHGQSWSQAQAFAEDVNRGADQKAADINIDQWCYLPLRIECR